MIIYLFLIKKKFPIILLISFVIIGFYFRISGISTNYSFWTDEAHISNVAKDIIIGEKKYLEGMKTLGVNYQPLYLSIVHLSFLFFGMTEFSARLPSVVLNTLGIVIAYLLASKLSSYKAGLIASFMMAFSQLNLSNAIQAKPYAILQTFFLIMLYILTHIFEKPNSKLLHTYIILAIIASSLLHFIGVLFAIPYIFFLTYTYKSNPIYASISSWKYGKIILLTILVSAIVNFPAMLKHLFAPVNGNFFLIYNNTTYLRELFADQYLFITLPALFGMLYVLTRKNIYTLGILLWAIVLIFLWNFRYYSHNIRYLVPLFGILIIYFAIFWDKAITTLFKSYATTLTLALIIILFVGGSKIVRKPNSYYSPNADFFADVQNANYKNAYKWIKKNINNYEQLPIINNLYETQQWYLGIAPPATFVKDYTFDLKHGEQSFHNITRKPLYSDLKSFKIYLDQNPQGLLIVEDWESILPEDIKQYAKKNMKLEYRVENLEVSPTDKWPIEIYSWGMEK